MREPSAWLDAPCTYYDVSAYCSVHPSLRIILVDACGGYIKAMNGTLQSPSFPQAYPMNKKCIWQLVAPAGYRITVNFTYFDLEGNNVSSFSLPITGYTYIVHQLLFIFMSRLLIEVRLY